MPNVTAVVGLGDLGSAVAQRLLGQGPLLLIDPDPAARVQWEGRNEVVVASSIDEAQWANVQRVHLLVRSQQQADSVLEELDRHATHLITVHLHTTVSAEAAVELGRRPRTNIRVLEQPITGGAAGVRAGSATVLTAGPADQDDRDWIGHLAATVVAFEHYGQPALAKLINNTVAAANAQVAASLLSTAAEHGLDAETMRNVLRHGSGGSWMAEFLPGLNDDRARLLIKDVRLLQAQVGEISAIRLDDEDSMLAGLALARTALTHESGAE